MTSNSFLLNNFPQSIHVLIRILVSLGKFDNTIVILASENVPTDWEFYYKPERYPVGYAGTLEPPGFTGPLSGSKTDQVQCMTAEQQT